MLRSWRRPSARPSHHVLGLHGGGPQRLRPLRHDGRCCQVNEAVAPRQQRVLGLRGGRHVRGQHRGGAGPAQQGNELHVHWRGVMLRPGISARPHQPGGAEGGGRNEQRPGGHHGHGAQHLAGAHARIPSPVVGPRGLRAELRLPLHPPRCQEPREPRLLLHQLRDALRRPARLRSVEGPRLAWPRAERGRLESAPPAGVGGDYRALPEQPNLATAHAGALQAGPFEERHAGGVPGRKTRQAGTEGRLIARVDASREDAFHGRAHAGARAVDRLRRWSQNRRHMEYLAKFGSLAAQIDFVRPVADTVATTVASCRAVAISDLQCRIQLLGGCRDPSPEKAIGRRLLLLFKARPGPVRSRLLGRGARKFGSAAGRSVS
mmetsp:Transcript_87465/g.252535  ORF Transcript_87465/g.252535 Transcript_87465/m.252535 type:complete len:377 (-) Transcript_87465:222-1352(-)